jgi:RNAse (barnase) inhibitor barstar
MRELVMDASEWKTVDDLFRSFFRVVEAPSWHGRSFNALRDSIGAGQINIIEVPYRLVFSNYDKIHPAVKEQAEHFIDVIHELAGQGVPVEIRVEHSN